MCVSLVIINESREDCGCANRKEMVTSHLEMVTPVTKILSTGLFDILVDSMSVR